LSLPFKFSNQNFVCIPHVSHATCYMHHPCHPPQFHHPNNIWWSIQVMKFLIMQSSPAPPPTTSSLLGSNILEDGGSMDLWNIILPQQYTASQPRRPQLESSLLQKPQNSNKLFFLFIKKWWYNLL
jgi:hypothetical protein